MIIQADIKPDFVCKSIAPVQCNDWEQRKADILSRYEDYVGRLKDDDLKRFKEKFEKYRNISIDHWKAMSKEQFDELQ